MTGTRYDLRTWPLEELLELCRNVLRHRFGRGRSRDWNLSKFGGSRAVRAALADRLTSRRGLAGLDAFMGSLGFKVRPHVLERERLERERLEAERALFAYNVDTDEAPR